RDHVEATPGAGGQPGPNGIVVRDASSATVRGCTVDGAPAVAFAVGTASDAKIEDSVATGARRGADGGGVGVLARDGARLRLTGSRVARCEAGGVVLVAADAELRA